MSARGLKHRISELGAAVVEDLVHSINDPARASESVTKLLELGWSKLEILEFHAAAVRGTLAELAIGGAVPPGSWRDPRAEGTAPVDWETEPDPPTLEEYTMRYVRETYADTGGNKSETAERLGVNRRTLYRMLEKMGLHTAVPRPRRKDNAVTIVTPKPGALDRIEVQGGRGAHTLPEERR